MIYKHKIQYYETDRQGVTHHSNYIRIMEEARVDALERLGLGFDRMEAEGVTSPVMTVTCDYRKPTTFADTIDVEISVAEMSPLKLTFSYRMTCNGVLVSTGTSKHCFLDRNGKPVVLQERFPSLYEALLTIHK